MRNVDDWLVWMYGMLCFVCGVAFGFAVGCNL